MRFVVNEHNQFANEGREKVHSVGFTVFQFMIGQPIRNLRLQCKPIKASEVIIYPFYNGKFKLGFQFDAVGWPIKLKQHANQSALSITMKSNLKFRANCGKRYLLDIYR